LNLDTFKATPLWEERRSGEQLAVNPKHRDYPCILAEALDVIFASGFDMQAASNTLQISATQLLKIVSHDNTALTWLNNERKERGIPTLKT
jgi:hypothetical protein